MIALRSYVKNVVEDVVNVVGLYVSLITWMITPLGYITVGE